MSIDIQKVIQVFVVGLLVCIILAWPFGSAAATYYQSNLVANSGFEHSKLSPWHYAKVGGAKAEGHLSKLHVHGGTYSYFLSDASPRHANVYARVYQTITNLKPVTTYRISAWVKGEDVGQVWIGGGYPGWGLRKHTPKGTFGWRQIMTTFTTHVDQTRFDLMILMESPTKSLWIDDVQLVNMDKTAQSKPSFHLPSIFTDHMVLQRGMPDLVWGWAAPGERVAVHFGVHEVSATADARGQWQVTLPAMPASDHGRNLTVVSDGHKLTVHDVVVGEVWLCSGQSNMGFKLPRAIGGKAAVRQSSAYPLIREIRVPRRPAGVPQYDFKGHWVVSGPKVAGKFTAVGYFFALALYKKLHIPVGLVESYWAGRQIQRWIPAVGYQHTPALKWDRHRLSQYEAKWRNMTSRYGAQIKEWLKNQQQASGFMQSIAEPPPPPRNPITRNHQTPTVLYNAMISPLVGYRLRGVVWYQGEANVNSRPQDYYNQLHTLIHSWRTLWNARYHNDDTGHDWVNDFPFILVQIAPWSGYRTGQEPKVWAAQINASEHIKNVGIVSTMDIGSQKTIHPPQKKPIGKRLMLWSLANVYGKKNVVYSGPRFASMQVHGDTVVIHFKHIGAGLAQRNGRPLKWFEIAGVDGKFVRAQAQIKGNTVVVHADDVAHPKTVRFAWSKMAVPSLENKQGLVALPFWTGKVQ